MLPSTPSVPVGSSLPRRLAAWFHERFPLLNALLFFMLYLASAAVARGSAQSVIALGPQDLVACLATWCFFLLLRVFDEHKDYTLDCANHPQRVLQSGLITLRHLKVAAVLAVAVQIGGSVWRDQGIGAASMAWLLMFAWACLMAKEFFMPDWLGKHLTWYAFSHMLIMPLVIWWLAQLAQPGTPLDTSLLVLMALSFISGLCFEITRKTRGPEEERDTVESYSRIFGTRGAAWIVLGLVTGMAVLQLALMLMTVEIRPWWTCALPFMGYVLAVRRIAAFLKAPSAMARSRNEVAVALAMLLGYAAVIAAVVAEHGLQIRV